MQMCGVFEGPDVALHLQSFSQSFVLFLPSGPEDTYLPTVIIALLAPPLSNTHPRPFG